MSRRVLATMAAGAVLLWTGSARAENVIRLGGISASASTHNLTFDGAVGTQQVLFHHHRRGYRSYYGGYGGYYGGYCIGYGGYYGGGYGCYGYGYGNGGYSPYYAGYGYGGYSPYYGNGYYGNGYYGNGYGYYGNGYYGNGYYGNGYYGGYYGNGYRYSSYYRCAQDGSAAITTLGAPPPVPQAPPTPKMPGPAPQGTFPYDGGPRVPMPMPETQPDPTLRKAFDARPMNAPAGSMYTAYGEQPSRPAQAPAAPAPGLRLVSSSGALIYR